MTRGNPLIAPFATLLSFVSRIDPRRLTGYDSL